MFRLIDELKQVLNWPCRCQKQAADSMECEYPDPLKNEDFPELQVIRYDFENQYRLTRRDLELGQADRFRFKPEHCAFLSQLIQAGISYSQACQRFNEKFKTSLKANQIHQRWNRVQDPSIKKGRWRPEEDRRLRELVYEPNYDIKQIVHRMGGRTLLQIRKRMKILDLCDTATY